MSRGRLVLVLIAAALAGGLAGLVAARLAAREFEATTLLTAYPDPSSGAFPVAASAPGIRRTLASDAQLIRVDPVVQNALRELPRGTSDGVRENVRAAPVSDTFMLEVTARDSSAARAVQLANAFANALVEYRRSWDAGRLNRAGDAIVSRLAELDDESPGAREQRRVMERELAQIVVESTFGQPPLEVVDAAASAKAAAVWPWVRYGAIGAAVGLALAILLIAMLHGAATRRISPRELARVHDQRLLGTLPRHGSLRAPLSDDGVPAHISDALWRVTEEVDRRRREGTYSVLITSAARFEGRSTVALALARALAMRGLRVLVLEADLAHPKLADLTGRPSKPGLAALAAGAADLGEVIHEIIGLRDEAGGVFALHAGDRVADPERLLAAPAVHQALQTLRATFDAVLIDPPAGFVGNELADNVDGVLVVGRPGMARRDDVAAFSRELWAIHDGAVMGLVINAARRGVAPA